MYKRQPLTLLGIVRLGLIFRESWGKEDFCGRLQAYSRKTLVEARRVARLVGLAYRVMGRPRLFRAVSSLYFTAVSFEETKRRLRQVPIDSAFLLGDHADYALRIDRCLAVLETMLDREIRSEEGEIGVERVIQEAVDPFNVIGIGAAPCMNWYPVEIDALFASRGKLDASHREIRSMLLSAGVDPEMLAGF